MSKEYGVITRSRSKARSKNEVEAVLELMVAPIKIKREEIAREGSQIDFVTRNVPWTLLSDMLPS